MATIICKTVEETMLLGETWARRCQGGEVFGLSGPLGAGKTQLVKGLARGLGYSGQVTSPTFTLIHEYEGGRLPLYHFDLYRLSDPRESVRLGLDDYFYGPGLCVVEWPERLAGLLPPHTEFWTIRLLDQNIREIETLSQP